MSVTLSISVVTVKDEDDADHSKSEDHSSPSFHKLYTDPVPSRFKTRFWVVQLVASSASQKFAVQDPANACSYTFAWTSFESPSLEHENKMASKKGNNIFILGCYFTK